MNFEAYLFFFRCRVCFLPGQCLALLDMVMLRRCRCPVFGQGTLWHLWALAQPHSQRSPPARRQREGAAEGQQGCVYTPEYQLESRHSFFFPQSLQCKTLLSMMPNISTYKETQPLKVAFPIG